MAEEYQDLRKVDWNVVKLVCDDCIQRVELIVRCGDDFEIRCHGDLMRCTATQNVRYTSEKKTVLLSALGPSLTPYTRDFVSSSIVDRTRSLSLDLRMARKLPIDAPLRDVALLFACGFEGDAHLGTVDEQHIESGMLRLAELYKAAVDSGKSASPSPVPKDESK